MKPAKTRKVTKREKFKESREKAEIEKERQGPAKDGIPLKLPYIIVFLCSFLLYSNTLDHGYALDDYSIILENRSTRKGVNAIPEIFQTSYRYGYYSTSDAIYRPVPKSMFAIEWQLAGGDPRLSHWINVILYTFSCLLVLKFMMMMSRQNLSLSFAIALLFLAHPIHTEVVANIKSRDEVLSLVFSLISLIMFKQWLRKKSNILFSGVLISFFLGLLSKESTITMLAIFPFVAWLSESKRAGQILKQTIPLLAVTILYFMIRSRVLDMQYDPVVSVADNLLMSAKSGMDRFCTAVSIMGLYFIKIIFPHPLAFDYSYNQIPVVGPGSIKFLGSLLLYLGLIFAGIRLTLKRNIIGFGILFFLITGSIYWNIFITIGSSFGERFMFIPSLGIVIGFSAWLFRYDDNRSSTGNKLAAMLPSAKWLKAVLLVILILYSVKTFNRNMVWENNRTLYQSDIKISPNSTRTHYYLGNLLVKEETWKGLPEKARRDTLYKAIGYLRNSVEILPTFSDPYIQMGVGYYHLKEFDKALESYQKAIEINPSNATTHNNIGTIYFEKGNYEAALGYFLKACQLDKTYAEAYCNAGSAYGVLNRYDEAVTMFMNAITYDPSYAQAYYFLSVTYANMGDQERSEFYKEKAAGLDATYR